MEEALEALVHQATAAATAVATGVEATVVDTVMAAVAATVTKDIAEDTTRQALTLRCECVWALRLRFVLFSFHVHIPRLSPSA